MKSTLKGIKGHIGSDTIIMETLIQCSTCDHMCVGAWATAHLWNSEDNSMELVLFFHISAGSGESNSGHKAHIASASTCWDILPARKCNQSRCPSMDKWMVNMWYIQTREFYLARKNNETIKFVGKGMELENIALREVTQAPKNKYCVFAFICRS